MPRRSSPSPPPGKRRRVERNDDGKDDVTTTAAPLSALVHPTTVIKAKVKAKVKSKAKASRSPTSDPLLCAFPRIAHYEASDRPRLARLAGYRRTCAWLSRCFSSQASQAAASLAHDIGQWLLQVRDTTAAAPLSHALQRDLAVGALVGDGGGRGDDVDVGLHAVLARLCQEDGRDSEHSLASPGNALFATLDASQASGSPRSILTACCQSWLRQADECLGVAASAVPPTAAALPLWQHLCRRYHDLGHSPSPPLLVLVLPCLPCPALWETLHYLINANAGADADAESTPRLAVLLQTGAGPAGIDGIETAHRRLLHLTVFSSSDSRTHTQDPRALVEDLFLSSSTQPRPPVRLPPSMARHCALAAVVEDDSSGAGAGLQRHIELSIQHYFTHDATCVLGCGQALRTSDFTPAFFAQLRHSLLATLGGTDNAEPALHLLPPHFRSRTALRTLLTDDQALLDSASAFLVLERAQAQARIKGSEMVALLCASASERTGAASTLDSSTSNLDINTRFALLFPAGTGTSPERTLLRKRINDAMAPLLRSLRRSESEGGMDMAQLETWLDRIEDWAGADSTDDVPALQAVLGDVRSLQQRLRVARDGGPGAGASGAGAGAEVDGADGKPHLTRVQLVERKLKMEEELRGLRGEIADWFSAAVRGMLLGGGGGGTDDAPLSGPPSLIDTRREEIEAQNRATAMDSLLSPSPRAHITLALGRPGVYLEAFAASLRVAREHSQSQSQSDFQGAPASHSRLAASLDAYFSSSGQGHAPEESAQTDLSIAYTLLREAGGAGTGVKGRLVNVFDWYGAWRLGVRAAARARARARGPSLGLHEDDEGEPPATPTPKKRGRGRLPKKRVHEEVAPPYAASDGDDDEDDTASAGGGPSLQARFAQSISTLALLGYIKKTRKGRVSASAAAANGGTNGAAAAPGGEVYVLKVGGWDVLPGMLE